MKTDKDEIWIVDMYRNAIDALSLAVHHVYGTKFFTVTDDEIFILWKIHRRELTAPNKLTLGALNALEICLGIIYYMKHSKKIESFEDFRIMVRDVIGVFDKLLPSDTEIDYDKPIEPLYPIQPIE